MRAVKILATLTVCYTTTTLAGGPTWCTLNDDCMGYSDEIITRTCCKLVKHKARYDTTFRVCLGDGGHPSNAVDHGAMAECCHNRGALRMCGCKASPLLVKSKPRIATHREWETYQLHDRPEPDPRVQPGPMAAAWQIPLGDPLVNSIHDWHMRENGTTRRLKDGRKKDDDYQKWCKRP